MPLLFFGVSQLFSSLGKFIADFSKAAHLFRAHIIIVAISMFLLWYEQSVDEYRALISNAFEGGLNIWSLVTFAISSFTLLVLFPFVIWFSARWLTNHDELGKQRKMHENKQPFRNSKDTANRTLEFLPRVLAILPVLMAAYASISNSRGADGLHLLIFGGLCLLASAIWLRFFISRKPDENFNYLSKYLKAEFNKLRTFLLSFLLINLILVWSFNVKLPQLAGTLTYGVGFFIVVLVFSTFLVWAHMRTRVPYMILIGLWAGILAIFNLTDNHAVTPLITEQAEKKGKLQAPPDFNTAFSAWLENKIAEDLKRGHKPDGKTPVFVVAAAGGGIFAAQNAAFVLAKLDDSLSGNGCGEFSRNVFTISSISGGSVGAALHGALLKDQAKLASASGCKNEQTALFPKLFNILNEDLLAPVIANFATLDYPQRLIPLPVFPDRAEALENAIITAVKDNHATAERYLVEAASDLWNASSGRPALVLNTAELGSGRTVASSPFTFRERRTENSKLSARYPRENATFREILAARPTKDAKIYQPAKNCSDTLEPIDDTDAFNENRDLNLLQAAVLSARFPYASPAGTITKLVADTCGNAKDETASTENLFAVKSQYIDGGYVEASGTEQALKLVKLMRDLVAKECAPPNREGRWCNVEIHMIAITLKRDDVIPDNSYGMVLTPPIGLLSTWSRRSKTSVEAARDYFKRTNDHIGSFHLIEPHDSRKEIPLGWRLSRPTSRKLEELICAAEPENGGRGTHEILNYLRGMVTTGELPEWTCLRKKSRAPQG